MSLAPIGNPNDTRTALGAASPAPAPATSQVGTPTGTQLNDPSLPATSQVSATGELQAAVDTLNRALQAANRDVVFSIDEDSKRVVVKIVDSETDDVIRQIPSEQALELSRTLDEGQGLGQGLILNGKA